MTAVPDAPGLRSVTGSRLATDVMVDVALEVLEADPYPTYAWMREHCPVGHVPRSGRVFVTTWDLCQQAGTDDTVFKPAERPLGVLPLDERDGRLSARPGPAAIEPSGG
jgi:cytochrome P450